MRLRKYRENAKITRMILAKRLLSKQGKKISVDGIKKHEEGKAWPNSKTQSDYAAVYGVSVEDLFPPNQRPVRNRHSSTQSHSL